MGEKGNVAIGTLLGLGAGLGASVLFKKKVDDLVLYRWYSPKANAYQVIAIKSLKVAFVCVGAADYPNLLYRTFQGLFPTERTAEGNIAELPSDFKVIASVDYKIPV